MLVAKLKEAEEELKALRARAAEKALMKEKAKEDRLAARQAKKEEMKRKAEEEREKRKIVRMMLLVILLSIIHNTVDITGIVFVICSTVHCVYIGVRRYS